MKVLKLLLFFLFITSPITSFGIDLRIKGSTTSFVDPNNATTEYTHIAIASASNTFSERKNSEPEYPFANKYDKISEFRSGFAVVEKDGKKGLVNESGEVIIPLKYDNITSAAYCGFFVLKTKKWVL